MSCVASESAETKMRESALQPLEEISKLRSCLLGPFALSATASTTDAPSARLKSSRSYAIEYLLEYFKDANSKLEFSSSTYPHFSAAKLPPKARFVLRKRKLEPLPSHTMTFAAETVSFDIIFKSRVADSPSSTRIKIPKSGRVETRVSNLPEAFEWNFSTMSGNSSAAAPLEYISTPLGASPSSSWPSKRSTQPPCDSSCSKSSNSELHPSSGGLPVKYGKSVSTDQVSKSANRQYSSLRVGKAIF